MKYNKKYKTASKKKSPIHLSYRSKLKIKSAVKYGLVLTIGLFIGSAFVGSSTPSADGDTFLDKVSATLDQVKSGLNLPLAYKYSVDILSIKPDSVDVIEIDYTKSPLYIEKELDISDIEVQITNNRDESITLDFEHSGIVYGDGSQESILKDSHGLTLPSKYKQSSIWTIKQFTLLPNAKKTFHLPFNRINRNMDPKLAISLVENPTGSVESSGDGMSRGKRKGDTKEFIIPLAPYF